MKAQAETVNNSTASHTPEEMKIIPLIGGEKAFIPHEF